MFFLVMKTHCKTVEGDLLDFPSGIQAIIHGCNTRNTMGAGIAAAIRKKFPEAYEADTLAYQAGKVVLGCWSAANLEDGRKIINLYQQENYNGKSGARLVSYDALAKGLTSIHEEICVKEGKKVGIPFNIGCGLANGNWNIVEAIVNSIFSPEELVIVKLPNT